MSSDAKRNPHKDASINLQEMPEEVKLKIAEFLDPTQNKLNQQISLNLQFFGDNQVWKSYLKPNSQSTIDARSVFKNFPAQRRSEYWPSIKDLPGLQTFHTNLMQSNSPDPHDLLKLAERVLQNESLITCRPYVTNILRDALNLNLLDVSMQAKIYMYLGDLILSEDLAIRMQDLPETIDREAFLREPPEEQAAACFRWLQL